MRESFEENILASGEIMKKSQSFIIANMSKTVAIITLIIATVVSFAEVGFSDLSAERFTSTLITMLLASYIIYFSLEDAGEALGRDTNDYKKALERYNEKKSKIWYNKTILFKEVRKGRRKRWRQECEDGKTNWFSGSFRSRCCSFLSRRLPF